MKFVFTDHPSIANKYIADLRDVTIQTNRARFRSNLKRLGELFAYEISKTLDYRKVEIETPLGIAETSVPADELVLATILRAGLPLYEGLLEVFDEADSAFASAYRRHHKDGTFEINMPYLTCPNLDGKVLILADPMLATGASLDVCLKSILAFGKPKRIHIVTAIASKAGVGFIRRLHPKVFVWAGAIDEELTAKSYIVPGLGDAGDLAYGPKLQE